MIHPSDMIKIYSSLLRYQVTIVFHVCGPHKPVLRSIDPANEIIAPTIQGMQTLCELCDRNPSVKRLIFLSCLDSKFLFCRFVPCSMDNDFVNLALADAFVNGKEYSEVDWNEVSQPTTNPSAYAKTAAEKYLFQYFSPPTDSTVEVSTQPRSTRKKPLVVVSIVAGVILGPCVSYQPSTLTRMATWREAADESLTPPHVANISSASSGSQPWIPRLSASHRLFISYLNGMNRAVANLSVNISDVRDTATALVIAAESSRVTQGRYILAAASPMTHVEMLQVVHDNFRDEVKVPNRRVSDGVARIAASLDRSGKGDYLLRHLGRRGLLNTVKARENGMALRPPVQTIVDTCRFLVEHNLIEAQSPQGCSIL